MISQIKTISHYIKDLSFENFAAQQNVFKQKKLDLKLDLNIKKKILKKNIFEITLIILLEAKIENKKQFIIELSYASAFFSEIVHTEEDSKKLAFIECPQLIYPFVRQIIFNITQDSGFPPVNLEHIDFKKLYHTQ